MKRSVVLFVVLVSGLWMAACKPKVETPKPETPPATETVDANYVPKDAKDKNAPEPTMVCAPSAAKSVRPAGVEKVTADPTTIENVLKAEEMAAAEARAKWAGKTFEEFQASLQKECVEGGKYIVSGDVAIADIKQLREFFETRIQAPPPPPPPQVEVTVDGMRVMQSALIIATSNGEEATWSSGQKRQISYCVSNSFNGLKPKVVGDMAAAAGAWEQVADVKFVYVATQDASCVASNNSVVFDVRPVDVGGDYYARAFFPNDPRADRNVLIDLSALFLTPGQDLSLVGILRHELGHTLGFRHEHTRPESGACFEDSNFVPITTYDSFSVMHYPQCNGGADWKLLLTTRDKSGAACLYGKATGFTIDTALCTPRVILPVPPDAPTVVNHAAQVVAKNAEKSYTPLAAKPGSIVKFSMKPSGATPGDPDLYVNFGPQSPRVRPPRYSCRPYLTGATEICELTVPAAPRNTVRYMVHGYTAGKYDLEVTYVKF